MHSVSVSKTSQNRTNPLEKYMECPRCKHKLLKYRLLSGDDENKLDKLQYIGICDHCHNQIQHGSQEEQYILRNIFGNDDNVVHTQEEKEKNKMVIKSPISYIKNKEGFVLNRSISDIQIDKINRHDDSQTNLIPNLLIEKKKHPEFGIIQPTNKDQLRSIKFAGDTELSMISKSDDTKDSSVKDQLLNDSINTLDSVDFEDLSKKWEKFKLVKNKEHVPQLVQTYIKDQLKNDSKEWQNNIRNISWSDDNVRTLEAEEIVKNFYKTRPLYSKKKTGVLLSRSFSDTQMDRLKWPDYLQTHFNDELLAGNKNSFVSKIMKPSIKNQDRGKKFKNDRDLFIIDSQIDIPEKHQFHTDSMKTLDDIDIENLSRKWEKIRLLKDNNEVSQFFDKNKRKFKSDISNKKFFDQLENGKNLEIDKEKLTQIQKYKHQFKLKSLSEINVRENIKAKKKKSSDDSDVLTSIPLPGKSLDDFQYFFPKRASLTNVPMYQKSSLELIKETLEKFNMLPGQKKDTIITPKKQADVTKNVVYDKTEKHLEQKEKEEEKKIEDNVEKEKISKEDSSKVKSKTIQKSEEIKVKIKSVVQEKPIKHLEKDKPKEKKISNDQEKAKKDLEKDKPKEKKISDDQEKAKKDLEKDKTKEKKILEAQKKEIKYPQKDKTKEKEIVENQPKEKDQIQKHKQKQQKISNDQEKEKKLLEKEKVPETTINDGQEKEKKLIEKDKSPEKKEPDIQEKEKQLLEKDKAEKKKSDGQEKKLDNQEKEKKLPEKDKTTEKKIPVGQEKEKKESLEKDKKTKKEPIKVKEKEKPDRTADENEVMRKMMEEKAKQKLEESKKVNKDENKMKETIVNENDTSTSKNDKQESSKENPVRETSSDFLITKMIKMKKREKRPKRLSEMNISPIQIKEHITHKFIPEPECIICTDSDVELDIENINFQKNKFDEFFDKVVGEKIIKCKQPVLNKETRIESSPTIYKTFFDEEFQFSPNDRKLKVTKESGQNAFRSTKSLTGQEMSKGVIKYTLSDRSFIDKGWTMLPTEKVVRKMNIYRMRPAHPEFDWFEHNKNKKEMHYDTGEKLAEFDDDGRGRWFYRNGKLALDYYDSEEVNTQQRIVIYSNGEPDERGRPRPLTILGTFDYLGNGVVFDHSGKIRLKYNQTEGVVLDRSIGPVSHWKWHTLNDPPVLQQVMIDTQLAHKDPVIMKLGGAADKTTKVDNEEMLAIEFDNFIKEKSKKLTQKFKPFQIKMKALKINENFSLKVLDQASVYLIYRDGTTNLKLNIGMILNHQEIVDTDSAEVGEVANSLERFPAQTDSLAVLQKSVEYAQRVERARMERDRRLRHPEPIASCDAIRAGISRPLRSRIYTIPSGSTIEKSECRCRNRNSFTNLYYDTRLI